MGEREDRALGRSALVTKPQLSQLDAYLYASSWKNWLQRRPCEGTSTLTESHILQISLMAANAIGSKSARARILTQVSTSAHVSREERSICDRRHGNGVLSVERATQTQRLFFITSITGLCCLFEQIQILYSTKEWVWQFNNPGMLGSSQTTNRYDDHYHATTRTAMATLGPGSIKRGSLVEEVELPITCWMIGY
jgi:hypothetical protein